MDRKLAVLTGAALSLLLFACSQEVEPVSTAEQAAPEATTKPAAPVAPSGREIPDFTLPAVAGGEPFRLSEARGRYVALHFLLKADCPICMKHMSGYATQANEVQGVQHVFIKPDDEADTLQWLERYPGSARRAPPVYRDAGAKLARTLGIPYGYHFHGQVVHYPAFVLIGPDGREAFRYVGRDTTDRYSFDHFKARMAALRE